MGTKAKNTVTYKDLEVTYLLGGIPALQKRLEVDMVGEDVIRRAAKDLAAANPVVAKDLMNFVRDQFPPPSSSRGKTPPEVGDKRAYKVQKVGDDGPFIRLPVASLGLEKGQEAMAYFQDGKISVVIE